MVEHKPKIAIVDDDPPISDMLRDVLYDVGFEPISCPHGARAYSVIRDAQPQVILLDVVMEGLNGVAVYHVLRRDRLTEDIPVVFLTANLAILERLLPDYQARTVSVIEKPFDITHLIGVIHGIVAHQPRRYGPVDELRRSARLAQQRVRLCSHPPQVSLTHSPIHSSVP